ncbi:MAG: membrane protein insertase YidC, partial [Betaproteobacteria bacterium]
MDTRRAILWIIFSMSLLLLWDAYMKHSGQGSFFGGPAVSTPTPEKSGTAAATAGQASAPVAPKADSTAIPSASKALSPSAQPAGPGPATATVVGAEKITLANNEIELEIDLQGARIVRAVLRDQISEAYDGQRVVLFDLVASRRYEAQSGLVGQSAAQVAFPNHTSLFKKGPLREDLDSKRHAVLVSESGGVKLTKTFSLDEKGHTIRVAHTVQNTGADALAPMIYLQLMRGGDRPPGESQFYQTFMGPAVFTQEGKFQKIDFSEIEKNKATHVKNASDGWFGIIQHYFVSAWIPKNDAPREFYTRRIENNLYSIGLIQALPSIPPGAQQTHEATLYAGPQLQSVLEKLAPGLDLVVDYGWLTFLAKPIYWLLE